MTLEGYSAFGTGVFDMDDHDAWEDLYDGDSKQQVDCDHMLKDADVEDEVDKRAPHNPMTSPPPSYSVRRLHQICVSTDDEACSIPLNRISFISIKFLSGWTSKSKVLGQDVPGTSGTHTSGYP